MTLSKTAFALALACGIAAVAVPAIAQTAAPAAAAPQRKFNLSPKATKAIVELQTAVNAKDTAAIPGKLAAAQALAKNKDDKYVIAQLQLKAAVDQNDNAGVAAAIEAMLASGGATAQETTNLYVNLGKQYYNAKQFDRAGATFERVLALEPANVEAFVLLAETRNAQNRTAEALAMLQKGINASVAAGRKPPEAWYKRAVAIAYNAKMPAAVTLSRDWVAAYPSPSAWRDALRIYESSRALDAASKLDLFRLQRAANALAGEGDYYDYAFTALQRGLPGEAKAVLEEGFAIKAINRGKPIFRDVLSRATSKAASDRGTLVGFEKSARASAAARPAMSTAEAYFGYGEYAKAAALYRLALGKAGVDANLANLRLGMALARAGDKPGATAAFNAVGGPRGEIARYWLNWLALRA